MEKTELESCGVNQLVINCELWQDMRLCAEQDTIVWGQASDFGNATVDYAGQVLDVWVVDVDGTLVVVHTEVSPGLPESVVEETRALFESLTLDVVQR